MQPDLTYTLPGTDWDFFYPTVESAPQTHRKRSMAAHTQAVERRLSIAENENLRLAIDIREYLAGVFPGLKSLPQTRKDYNTMRYDLWVEPETGEIRVDLEEYYSPLIKLYYSLFNNYHAGSKRTLGTLYMADDGNVATAPKQICTSRHKLNQVWNFYKSNIIRGKFKKLLQEMDAVGTLRDYHPVHITLTVPRDADGNFQGQRFFGEKLLYWFNLMRKYPFMRDAVFGGEVGLETKKGANGLGYHQHLHSFTLLHKGTNMRKFRKELAKCWEQLTGGKAVWVETLYKTERHKNGKPVYHYVYNSKGGKWTLSVDEYKEALKTDPAIKDLYRKEVKKIYVDPATSPIEDYISGIMECIKYHFKPAMFLERYTGADGKVKSKHDIASILEVLQNTHRKRLYTRFGFFFGLKQLALSFKEEKEGTEVISIDSLIDGSYFDTPEGRKVPITADWMNDDIDEENQLHQQLKDEQSLDTTILGNTVPDTDVNPFTLQTGELAGGWPVLYNVNNRKHPKNKRYYQRFELSPHKEYDLADFIFLKKDIDVPKLIQLMALGRATYSNLKKYDMIDIPIQTMQQNLNMLYNATKHIFGPDESLATNARRRAIELIESRSETHIYSEPIVKEIRKGRERTARLNYWRAADSIGKGAMAQPEAKQADGRLQLVSQTQRAEMTKQATGTDTDKILAKLNIPGRLKMRIEEQVYYLRCLGWGITIADNGKIAKITEPKTKEALQTQFFSNENW